MPSIDSGRGDRLARGDSKATFGPPNVTQEEWDRIWRTEPSAEDLDKVAEEEKVKEATKEQP